MSYTVQMDSNSDILHVLSSLTQTYWDIFKWVLSCIYYFLVKAIEIHTALTNAVRWPSSCRSLCLSACRKTRGTLILYRPSTAATSCGVIQVQNKHVRDAGSRHATVITLRPFCTTSGSLTKGLFVRHSCLLINGHSKWSVMLSWTFGCSLLVRGCPWA